MIFSVLVSVIVAAFLVVIIMTFKGLKNEKSSSKKVTDRIQKKGKSAIIREAEKKLVKDPHNVQALETIGDLYYSEKNWEKVWYIYKNLYDISAAHVEIDVAKCALRLGMAAYNMEKLDEATKALLLSMKRNPDVFETCFYLGKVFYKTNTFDTALYCFKKAKVIMPENMEVNEMIGLSLFKMQKYRESIPYIKRVLEEKTDNKELTFYMAVSMGECGLGEKALKFFMHLRTDPSYGAQSCLEAGKIHERSKDYANAIKDYEIANKLTDVPENIALQIKYRQANDYIQMNEISKGLDVLRQIQMKKTGYKDVDQLVLRYGELNQNKNLQTYLLSSTSDFVALCRKFISIYHKDSFLKVENVQVASESVEIIGNIENSKWESKQIFRFYRTQNIIGDIYIREFHGKIRDTKCDAGYCVTMGSFTDSAHKYTEGRPIDLIEKEELVKILKKINMFG